jgi:hypothetical protein
VVAPWENSKRCTKEIYKSWKTSQHFNYLLKQKENFTQKEVLKRFINLGKQDNISI